MDTVLGLSITSGTVGWVLVDGQDVAGPALADAEFTVRRHRGGVRAVDTAAQATAAVLRVRTTVEAQGRWLRGIGVTWADDAAAEAALVLESLARAGFDDVVPVRFRDAAEALIREAGPTVGSGQTAVCVVESGLATLAVADGCDDATATATRHAVNCDDDVTGWLTTVFGTVGRRPEALVLAGSDAGLDELAARLEADLGVPVSVRSGAQPVLARGAARALRPGGQLARTAPDGAPSERADVRRPRARTLSYAGALTMLVASALTFVVSLSIALSLQLVPANDLPPAQRVAVRVPAASPAGPVTAIESPAPRATALSDSAREGASEDGGAFASTEPAAPRRPDGHRSLLVRVLEHIPGLRSR